MHTMKLKLTIALVMGAAGQTACDDPPEAQDMPTFMFDAGSQMADAATQVAPEADASTAQGGAVAVVDFDANVPKPPRQGPVYAVVSSDYAATAISLLGEDGNVLADDYLTSGSVRAGLVTALSGDVELPKASGESGVLVVIDRFKTDVITRVRLSDGNVLGQVKTHTPATQSSTTAYTSNPFDYIYINPETAWVVRAQPNLDPAAPAIERGDDLFRINPTTMTRTDDRIDLDVLNTKTSLVDAATNTMNEVILHSRPGRMARLGQTVVVGIGRTAYDFSAVGDGVVALVNLDTKSVSGFDLPGLKKCDNVQSIPNDNDSVLVTCNGDFKAVQKDTAGIAMLQVVDGKATLEHVYRAKDDAAVKPYTSAVVALGGTFVGVASNDYSGKAPDVFAVLDLATGKKTELLSLIGSGAFGTPTYNSDTKLLLLPDASKNADKKPKAGVHRFQRNADGSFSELPMVKVSENTGMPVRHVYPL
jgi:hypothetical protein